MNINIGGSDFDEDDALEEAYEEFGEIPIIKVFVEGFDDKRFWGKLLSEHGFAPFNIDAVGVEAKANGKGTLISLLKEGKITLGKYNIVCMDSDYDNFTGDNQDILNSKYCFQTYAYSIENFHFHPSGLLHLCCDIAGHYATQNVPNLESLVTDWSKEYFNAFLTHLHGGQRNSIKQLVQKLKFDGVLSEQPQTPPPPAEVFDIANNIGLHQENMFLFYRGHNFEAQMKRVANRVIIQLLRPVIDTINDNHTADKKKSLISQCRANILDLETAVALRTIPDNTLYQKIISDINNFNAA
ncbi:DUF4435 domain-containing protein [Vibrio parahaemolyticus]|uniref:DUF4435 domain-containing protein n=1 Tax=Vibrio parahaemolyticus TaxID=670 RepID=UPI0015DA00BE|nr:DUF4435 domain-containing protein [Vibrio parahaemolyticus]EGR9014877.1 DUF4435 domain-containing protein [Vibrio parahaemolyticus]